MAGNYHHPTSTDCNSWVTKAWSGLKMNGVLRKAEGLGMAAAPGPEVEGYVDEAFQDVEPAGEEEDLGDEKLWNDLLRAEEEKL